MRGSKWSWEKIPLFVGLILAVLLVQVEVEGKTRTSFSDSFSDSEEASTPLPVYPGRAKRGVKDALPKDNEFSQSRAILDMRYKILALENSVKNVNVEIELLSKQNVELEEQITEQKSMFTRLNDEFAGMVQTLASHQNTLGDIEKIVSPTENLFALSNQTCGGVLVGQSGSIVFTNSAIRGLRHPSSCIWTIRANNREKIKISTHAPIRSYSYSYRPFAHVVELLYGENGNDTVINSAPQIKTRVTKLQRSFHHIFSGPLIFVVYPLGPQSDDYSDIELHLQYEGLGKLVSKEVHFSHEALYRNSGSFSDDLVEPERWDDVPANTTFSMDYISIVISNYSTKVNLEAKLKEGMSCSGKDDSFVVITELLDPNNTELVDCCKRDCTGKNSLVNYDNPFVILISKSFEAPMNFNLTWVAETPYPSSSGPSGSLYGYKCGEILGGISGTLAYKPHLSYRNGERCIWVIVPQPRPRQSISISVGANGVENTYDHLYMMELTDVNGTALDEPKITRLGRYGSYTANSRELYVVFYSDSSVTGYGFSLSWRSFGDVVKTRNDVTTKFHLLQDDDGRAHSTDLVPLLTNGVYEVFILTPVVPSAYVFGMQLHINQTNPAPGPRDCLHQDIVLYTAMDGLMNKAEIECNNPGEAVIDHADGLAMIVLDNRDAVSNVAMNFSWRQEYGEGNETYVVVENNQCGGVIKGSKGILKYKIGFDYLNNEMCVWLLEAPNATSITLKLLKDGFETCCDHILVNTIEPGNGTLRNDTVTINRQNRTKTFEESVLVLVFRSDASTRGRGFALQFTANGKRESPPEFRYQLRHRSEPFGVVTYPDSEWERAVSGSEIEHIFVIASSVKIGADEDPLSMPTNVSWITGTFHKHPREECVYESITFYSTPEPGGWSERVRYPNSNQTESCPQAGIEVQRQDNIFSTVYSTFIAIYKPIRVLTEEEEMEEEEQGLVQETSMSFMYKKSAGCGGVIIADSGEIRYKENVPYSNLEKCIWLVHAPQADKIRFWLERSGFEECCDLLSVSTIDRTMGIPHQATVITQFNRTAIVDGPVAIITFTSDSSVIGEGFRLTFTTETETTSDFPYVYHVEHRNQLIQNNFVYQVEPNELVIIAYSPEIHRQSYQGLGQTTVTVASLRPQQDEECHSDSLTIYDVYGRETGLKEGISFKAIDVIRDVVTEDDLNGTCSPLKDSNYHPCSNILDCGDTPEDNEFKSNTTSFLAVYRSVNVTSEELSYRGFVMFSKTNFPTGEDTTSTLTHTRRMITRSMTRRLG